MGPSAPGCSRTGQLQRLAIVRHKYGKRGGHTAGSVASTGEGPRGVASCPVEVTLSDQYLDIGGNQRGITRWQVAEIERYAQLRAGARCQVLGLPSVQTGGTREPGTFAETSDQII